MRVLIIGALDGQIGIASQIAIARGAKVMQADNIEEALDTLRGGHGAELVMIDVGLDIAHLMNNLTAERITIPVVACGMTTDADAAVRAIESGAKEFIPLPPQADLIAAVFEAVAEERHALIFRDPKMAELVRLADRVALVDASVLITGESGTGKEVLARYIYGKSKRADRPFITVNCAAIPENLLESELFGHEKGAFTGAVARRVGKFEAANSGTLLLDEISEMDTRLQAKLMRAIQEREIDRVGGNHPIPVDIRLIATSNRDLDAAVAKGDFREDLLYRINVVNLTVPPLRTRPSDIEALAEHFVQKYTELNDVEEKQLTPETLTRLKAHAWRGNARELENTIHRGGGVFERPDNRPGHRDAARCFAGRPGLASERGGKRRRTRSGVVHQPHGRRSGARPDSRNSRSLPRQPDPRRQYPGDIDPDVAQQDQAIHRRGCAGCDAARSGSGNGLENRFRIYGEP